MFSDKWNKRFMELAFLIASWSKDPSTKTGAVVVGPDREIRATGYNGLVRGVDDDNTANITVITELALEKNMRRAVEDFEKDKFINKVNSLIRVQV